MDKLRESLSAALPSTVAETLVEMEEEFSKNLEAIPDNGEVEKLTGHKPILFREWAEKNKAAWV